MVTYKERVYVVKAQDMFDDHEGWQREFAERAQVIGFRRASGTNTFDNMLQAYEIMIRAERVGEKQLMIKWIRLIWSDDDWNEAVRRSLILAGLQLQLKSPGSGSKILKSQQHAGQLFSTPPSEAIHIG